jgi:hypothetical protein
MLRYTYIVLFSYTIIAFSERYVLWRIANGSSLLNKTASSHALLNMQHNTPGRCLTFQCRYDEAWPTSLTTGPRFFHTHGKPIKDTPSITCLHLVLNFPWTAPIWSEIREFHFKKGILQRLLLPALILAFNRRSGFSSVYPRYIGDQHYWTLIASF